MWPVVLLLGSALEECLRLCLRKHEWVCLLEYCCIVKKKKKQKHPKCPSVVQFSRSVVPDSLWPHGLRHIRPPCPSPTPGAYSNPRPLSRWCHPTISSSVIPFFCLQSFPASGSSPRSQFFASGNQRIGISASASVLTMNIQDWCPLGWTSWISLQSKGLSRVFANTTVQKHQFFGTQLSHPTLKSTRDYWKNHSFD